MAYPDSREVFAQPACEEAVLNLKRWIFPVAVLGSSGTNWIQRGYLYGASRLLTCICSSSAVTDCPDLSTTNALGLTSSSVSAIPITAASSTDACVMRQASTSKGET